MMPIILNTSLKFLQQEIAGNTVADLIRFAILITAALLLIKPIVNGIFRLTVYSFRKWFPDNSERPELKRMTNSPLQKLLQCVLIYAAIHQLEQPFNITLIHRKNFSLRLIELIDHIFLFCVILFAAQLVSSAIDFFFQRRYIRAVDEKDPDKSRILPLVRDVFKILIWATSVFFILGTVFHVNVPALITGLGIGGIAIALAGKETVENLFAAFTILADKPFHSGDNIKLGTLEGVVVKIGFRSTRLRTPDGTILVVPNKKLIDENLENLTVRKSHRIRIPLNIKYGLSEIQLQNLLDQLSKFLKAHPKTINNAEIAVEAFEENGLRLMITYHLPNPIQNGNLAAIKEEILIKMFSIINEIAIIPGGPGITTVRILNEETQ